MFFNSIEFAIFLTTVLSVYWFVFEKNVKSQNTLLLLASYFFYGWWDWRFLILLAALSLLNYIIGRKLENIEFQKKRKIWLLAGLTINISILGVFKYFNFFISGFVDMAAIFGYELPQITLKLILPLGISFYVFLSLSYIIDVYNKKLSGNNNVIDVLLALSFFPIILAGPIQRPLTLLPQIKNLRVFDYDQGVDGLKQILWGLFAKVVIADKLAPVVDDIFLNYPNHTGSTLAIGALFFTVQIYADFSGYSNMAIGIAKLLGFNLMQNFAYPYFSRDITEFWKRWHISLTNWFRDYLFLPLSFSISWKISKGRIFYLKTEEFIYISASLITWFLTGLWHGANYTFLTWGFLNGLLLIFYHLMKQPRKRLFKRYELNNKSISLITIETLFTLLFITIAWIFFRANSVEEAFLYIKILFSKSLFTFPAIIPGASLITISIFFVIEWFGRENQYGLAKLGVSWKRSLRWAVYYALAAAVILMAGNEHAFIYFQF